MKNRTKILLLPFIISTLSGCSFLNNIFNIENEDNTTINTDHIVNIGEFRNAVNLGYKNFTFTSTFSSSSGEKEYTTVKALEDGSFYQKCNDADSEYYWKRDNDGSYIRISKYENNWIVDKIVNKLTFETDYYSDDSELIWAISDLAGNYSEFSYSQDTNYYQSTIAIKGVSTGVSLKFDNKKLSEVLIASSGSLPSITVRFSDYNSTSIDFDSLHVKNNLYVSGRTFTFKELRCETPIPNLDLNEFNESNAGSELVFDELNSFSMHFEMNFMSPFIECDYSGTYSYNKLDQTLTLMVLFNYSTINIQCSLTIDQNNYISGALLTARIYAPSYGLDAYVDFYIK